MKLVCFSNNTAGGLVCDLLNQKTSIISGYKTAGPEHSAFKIGDTPTVQRTVNPILWGEAVKRNNLNIWLGTHLHPSGIPDRSQFQQILSITTETRQSKLYRWLRYYHGWFKNSHPDCTESNDLSRIDQIRELAKNVFEPFESFSGCWNVEFEDIVNGVFVTEHGLDIQHFNQWQKANDFLYNLSDSWAIQRFNEAEWELTYKRPYKYI